jgi:DNA-binding response OmpR family regulator
MKRRIHVLFVDDEEAVRILVKNQLVLEGLDVDTADDGDTAIQALKTKTYDLVMIDIRMPRMNGIELLKYMKTQKIPSRIIMLTAVDDLNVALEAVRNGANDYVTKPYDFAGLMRAIRKVVSW